MDRGIDNALLYIAPSYMPYLPARARAPYLAIMKRLKKRRLLCTRRCSRSVHSGPRRNIDFLICFHFSPLAFDNGFFKAEATAKKWLRKRSTQISRRRYLCAATIRESEIIKFNFSFLFYLSFIFIFEFYFLL